MWVKVGSGRVMSMSLSLSLPLPFEHCPRSDLDTRMWDRGCMLVFFLLAPVAAAAVFIPALHTTHYSQLLRHHLMHVVCSSLPVVACSVEPKRDETCQLPAPPHVDVLVKIIYI